MKAIWTLAKITDCRSSRLSSSANCISSKHKRINFWIERNRITSMKIAVNLEDLATTPLRKKEAMSLPAVPQRRVSVPSEEIEEDLGSPGEDTV